MYVKICGIKTLQDAQAAVEAGADMLGFNFDLQSPRSITPQACAEIVAALHRQPRPGPALELVGVFANASAEEIQNTLETCHLQRAQLAGDEAPDVLVELGGRAFKVIRPRNTDEMLTCLRTYLAASHAPAYLFDASVVERYGGVDQTAAWGLARALTKRMPILLAGGLTPDNVRLAIEQVRPWGVDVDASVEFSSASRSTAGLKDFQKMRAFVQNAKGAG